MGSVTSDTTCPQCGDSNAIKDFYYREQKTFVMCQNCGYASEDDIVTPGAGAFRVQMTGSVGADLGATSDAANLPSLEAGLREGVTAGDIEACELRRWNPDTKTSEVVFAYQADRLA